MQSRPTSGWLAPGVSQTLRRWRRVIAALVVAVSVAGLSACGSSDPDAKTSGGGASGGAIKQADLITVAANSAPLSLDPAYSSATADTLLYMDLAYEPLIFLAPDGSYKSGLATSWKYGEGMRTFELTLREGVRFSDGSPLTADAVVASLEHQKKATGPPAPYMATIDSVEATGPLSVRLNLTEPNPDMPLLLSQNYLIGDVISPRAAANPRMLAKQSAGAGPYMLDAAATVSRDHYTYVPNPHYYNPDAIHFKKFVIKVIENPDAALNALKTGQVAFATGSATTAPQAEAAGLAVHATVYGLNGAFLLDRNGEVSKPLGDQRVRQALNYATDRVGITKALTGEYGHPSSSLIVPGYRGYDESLDDRYPYDPEKAKELLAEAGYPDGFSVEIGATPSLGNGVAVAQTLASSWAKVGVDVKVKSYPSLTQIAAPWGGKQLPITISDYGAQPMSVMWALSFTPAGGYYNIFRAEDEELTALVERAKATTGSETELQAAWAAVHKRIVELGWVVPIYHGSSVFFAQKSVGGIEISPRAFNPDPVLWYLNG